MHRKTSAKSIRELFLAALDYENPSARSAFLEESCGVETTRRREVEQLLAVHESGVSSPLDEAVARLVPQARLMEEASARAEIDLSTRPAIGPYQLREQIGEGGFGVVYVAEQSVPVKRKVALKIIKPGMETKEVIARFEAERQALAMMDHPHIAKVYDAGMTETGRPYFVMELIRGKPITWFCRERELSLPEQLELFIDVCRAVQHAHHKGILHRDLKPSNILVTLHDGVPVVKVIDFGVAKALTQKLTDQTIYTRHAQMIGTPAYMSPEQAELSGLDMDTRSDVYSLGVLLYELLTGTTPFDQRELVSKGYDEMRRILREDDPSRPSHRVSTLDFETQSTMCQDRGRDLRQWSLALKRELDWIVMKALEKNRERRYESASAFAADVERYLKDERVLACPPSLGYRLRKTARRHKGLLATLALVFLTAIVGMAVSLSYARKATIIAGEARDAQKAAERLAAIAAEHANRAEEKERIAENAERELRTLLYASDLQLVSDALLDRDVPLAAELLQRHVPKDGERDLRGFEWHFFQKQIHHSPRATFQHGTTVRDVEISPDGKWLAATAALGGVPIYETATWSKQKTFWTMTEEVNGLAWSRDGRQLAAACTDGSVRVWDFSTGIQIWDIDAHPGGANDVLFHSDGEKLYSCGNDDLAKCWNLKTGKVAQVFPGHERDVERIDLSPDGSQLATASSDHSSALWNAQTAERLHHIQPEGASRCVSVRFSPDGQWLAIGHISGTLLLIDPKTGQEKWSSKERDGIEALVFLDEGRWLVTADRGGTIQYRSLPRMLGKRPQSGTAWPLRWVAHQDRALSLTAMPDGRGLVSGGREGLVRAWSPDLDATRWSLDEVNDLSDFATGPNDRLYVAGQTIRIWDLNRREWIGSLPVDGPAWRFVACSADGKSLAAVRRGLVAVYDLANSKLDRTWTLESDIKPHRLTISPDGRWIAFLDHTDREFVTVFDREGANLPPRKFPARQCNAAAFSPDGRWMAAGHQDDFRVFELDGESDFREVKAHSNALADLAFSPDGRLLASVGHDRVLNLWQVEPWDDQFSIAASDAEVESVGFHPNGRTIALAGADDLVKLWDAATGQPLGDLPPESNGFRKVRFSADGFKLIAQDRTGRILVYDASPGSNPAD